MNGSRAVAALSLRHLLGISSVPCCLQRCSKLPVRSMSTASQKFDEAKSKLKTLSEEPSNAVKLQLYGLFKQATLGKCTEKKPGMLDLVGKTKWEAWNSLGDMTKDKAMEAYAKLVGELAATTSTSAQTGTAESLGSFPNFLVTKQDGVGAIVINRPSKKNAFLQDMFVEFREALELVAKDDQVKVATVTGAGDFFTSGNDLANVVQWTTGQGKEKRLETGVSYISEMIKSFIDFPKPLIALVNGPAVGIGTTFAGHCDAVYASDQAFFLAPFVPLGINPEACSSYLFPKIMGAPKANQLLLFGKKVTADEAYELGLVCQVFPHHSFKSETDRIVRAISKLPPETMRLSKDLVKANERKYLHKVNDVEMAMLKERVQSKECADAAKAFFKRSK